MRTTLTLDDDVAMLLKKFSQKAGLTFRDAVNQSIRRVNVPDVNLLVHAMNVGPSAL